MNCIVCHSSSWEELPDPSPTKSLLSDFRELDEPLMKQTCLTCGSAARKRNSLPSTYDTYALYAHPGGGAFEVRRQSDYAAWLSRVFPIPESVFEAGCGNGSFLAALREIWPSVHFHGREPSRVAAGHAREYGLEVEVGYVDSASIAGRTYDLALSINVLEHVPDPVEFLGGLARYSPKQVAVVCPDGELPNVELLFADHLHSFTRTNLAVLFAKAGMTVLRQEAAPASIGPFWLTVGVLSNGARFAHAVRRSIGAERRRYLEAWQKLDRLLLERIEDRDALCFGAGEAAALLRTYAPQSWSRVEYCTVDHVDVDRFGDKPVVAYGDLAPQTIILATRPSSQQALAARLGADGHRVVSWHDLVAS